MNLVFHGRPRSTKRSWNGEYLTTNNQCLKQKNTIAVSTYQMCVLDLFNSQFSWHNDLWSNYLIFIFHVVFCFYLCSWLNLQEILRETNIPEKFLVIALQELVSGYHIHRLIMKNPKCKEIKPGDEFYVNESIVYE